MFTRIAIASRRLACALVVGLCLTGPAGATEPGHILTYKLPGGFQFEVRKVRTLQRVEGFYVGQSFAGKDERFDAFNVGTVVDLGALQPANIRQPEDLAEAKAIEQRTTTVLKQHPLLVTEVAPRLAELRADIARAERGDRKIDGKWFTAQQVAEMQAREQSTVTRGVLNLRDGTSYRDVEIVSANQHELRIMHADGAAKIPMRLVPEDFQRKYLQSILPPAGR